MQTIDAFKLFKNNVYMENLSFEEDDEIFIDFINVSTIEMKDIATLLDIQKVAFLNQKRVKIDNVSPEIKQILEITGLYKTFSNMMTNPVFISKRLSNGYR